MRTPAQRSCRWCWCSTRKTRALWCTAASWQLDARLTQADSDLRIRKRTPNSFHGTDLQGLLQGRGVSRLVVCGLQSEFCVDTAVRQALSLGYDVVLVADAYSTMDTEALSAAQISAHHNQTLQHMTSFGPAMAVQPAQAVELNA